MPKHDYALHEGLSIEIVDKRGTCELGNAKGQRCSWANVRTESSLVFCIALANNDAPTKQMDLQVMKEKEIVAAHSSFMKDERKVEKKS